MKRRNMNIACVITTLLVFTACIATAIAEVL